MSEVLAAVGVNRPPHCICGSPTPNPRERRLQIDTAAVVTKLYRRAAEGRDVARNDETLVKLIEEMS